MQILCIGQLVADIVVRPVDGVSFDVDTVRVDDIQLKNGGDAMNTAMGLRRLENSVRFIGCVGRDMLGDYLSNVLKKAGIEAELTCADGTATSATVVLINTCGERTFLHLAGANALLCTADIGTDALGAAGLVHIGGTYILPRLDGKGAAEVFRKAQQGGALTSMDVTYDVTGKWLSTIAPCLPWLTYFLPSLNEAKEICGSDDPERIGEILLRAGVKTAVIKLGESGCYVRSKEEAFYQKAYPAQVRDTTGAGDAFVAGFLTGVAEGRPLGDCAKLACAAGAVCVTQVGATTEKMSRQAIREICGI